MVSERSDGLEAPSTGPVLLCVVFSLIRSVKDGAAFKTSHRAYLALCGIL